MVAEALAWKKTQMTRTYIESLKPQASHSAHEARQLLNYGDAHIEQLCDGTMKMVGAYNVLSQARKLGPYISCCLSYVTVKNHNVTRVNLLVLRPSYWTIYLT